MDNKPNRVLTMLPSVKQLDHAPIYTDSQPVLESLGIEVKGLSVGQDEKYYDVILPPGWTKVKTSDHWAEIRDEKGVPVLQFVFNQPIQTILPYLTIL